MSFSFSLHDAPAPLAAVEMTGGRITGVSLDTRDGRSVIAAHAVEVVPEPALVPALNAQNIRDRAAVALALGKVLERIGRPRRIGLVLGDPVAKVSLVRLQQVPARPQELEQVIRWQVRKSAPFAIEEAQVGFQGGLRSAEGQDFIVTLAKRDVIEEYESLCAAAGAHAGIVDTSTFNVVNAVIASRQAPAGDWLLVNVAPGWESIAIMRGAELIFFRNRSADGEGTLADLVHQTAMYYEDRLGGAGFGRALLCGAAGAGAIESIQRTLAERLGVAVDTVDGSSAVSFADRIGTDGVLGAVVTPLVGLLLRAREAA